MNIIGAIEHLFITTIEKATLKLEATSAAIRAETATRANIRKEALGRMRVIHWIPISKWKGEPEVLLWYADFKKVRVASSFQYHPVSDKHVTHYAVVPKGPTE